MTRKTAFQPEVNGFAFVNSWRFSDTESHEMLDTLFGSVNRVGNALPNVATAIGSSSITAILRGWTDGLMPEAYGMCGGMAFAALDYFLQDKLPPRGKHAKDQPDPADEKGKRLRDYLWRRQVESFRANAPQLLAWMVLLHLPIPFAGPGWLLTKTRQEFDKLKHHIDDGTPWPLCLIGTSTNPFDNHQVLAYGYEDPDSGTATIFLYDMNCPGAEQKLELDLRGDHLRAKESCASQARGPLRGFFCEAYQPDKPPPE